MLSSHSNPGLREVVYDVEQPTRGKSIITMKFDIKFTAEVLKCVKIKMIGNFEVRKMVFTFAH